MLNNGPGVTRLRPVRVLRPSVTVDVQAVALARGMIDEQRTVHRPEHRKKRVGSGTCWTRIGWVHWTKS